MQQYQQQRVEYQPSAYEKALNDEGLAWLNATSGKEPLDISALPGMQPYLDLYNTAVSKQKGQRLGLGTFQAGAASANPNMIAALAQQEEAHRRQDAGAQLNQAFALRNAEVRGSALPLIGISENRSANRFGTAANMANASAGRWSQHQVRPGFWAGMLNNITQGAGQGALAAAV